MLENAGCVWTVAVFGEKSLRFRKYPVTCGRGLNEHCEKVYNFVVKRRLTLILYRHFPFAGIDVCFHKSWIK